MSSITTQITVSKRLRDLFTDGAPRMRRSIKTAVLAIALDIERSAKRRVRVNTGVLRDSIHANLKIETDDVLVVEVGTSNAHAGFEEYGTGQAGARTYPGDKLSGGYRHGLSTGQAAHPFMYPARRENRENFKTRMVKAVRDGVR